MSARRVKLETEEALGIVISEGVRPEVAPVFRAYVWGPAPDRRKETGQWCRGQAIIAEVMAAPASSFSRGGDP